MYVRIFATDGLTPFNIFKRSVKDCSEICEAQILWITRTDKAGWKESMDWFIRQPTARAAIVDTANKWEWFKEHEITLRILRALYFDEEEKIDGICWCHDDMAPPTGNGFINWLRAWKESDSTCFLANCYEMWDDFDTVLADRTAPLDEAHCWMAKLRDNLRWVAHKGKDDGGPPEAWERFIPVERSNEWVCPYGFRHYKGVDEAHRSGWHLKNDRKGWCQRWKDPQAKPKTIKYDPDMKWEDFIQVVNHP